MQRSWLSRKSRRYRARWARWSHPLFGPIRRSWKRSLKLRTMTITGAITGIMIVVSGSFLLTTLAEELNTSRRDQVLQDSARATEAAQRLVDASDASDRGALSALVTSVRRAVQDTSSSELMYLRRQPNQESSPQAPADFFTSTQVVDAVSDELLAALQVGASPQFWQSVSLADELGAAVPGILVASSVDFPAGAGTYDLIIGYSLAETQKTLNFITQTLAVTTLFLMLLIGALVWTISRIVFRPIRAAADASRRLAEGDDAARMPLQNDEDFDTLSVNFNTMADTLQARIFELDRLSELQQRFVSDVSHELRTPLTTIRLASEVLKHGVDRSTPSHVRATEVMSTQVDRFERLLGDLLEISRYDAGRVVLETESVQILALTEEIVNDLLPLSGSPIELRPLGGYSPIDADPRRIRRIVSNLLGNAIEHGEGKPVVITVDSNSTALSIGVRDWGIGMSEQSAQRVFDRFWRADPSRKRTLGGTGLGLAIAQEDAAVHGGVIEVWSRVGEGSHFRLTIPRVDAVHSFLSPIPLIPEDVQADHTSAAGWLRRPWRMVTKSAQGQDLS